MYRVELKDFLLEGFFEFFILFVPNVPCGVESYLYAIKLMQPFQLLVPNVPCGVERRELQGLTSSQRGVPNVPCGVERYPFAIF